MRVLIAACDQPDHEEIRKITAPVLLVAGEYEHLIGFDEASLSEDAARLGGKAEFEVFAGFSHFMAFEVREDGAKGHDLVTARMDKFYAGLN